MVKPAIIYQRILLVLISTLLFLNLTSCNAIYPSATPFQCADKLGCINIAPGKPLKLGGLQTLSGGSSPAGIEQEHSIRLAVELRGGKILGHPIQLQFEDEYCSSEGGANAALRIVADPQIVAILGTNCSSAAITAGKIMSERGLVMVSSANTSPSLTSVGGKQGANWVPGYYRTSWNDSAMGRAAAIFAFQKLGLKKAAVVNAGDAYTKGLTDVFSQVFTDLGGQMVLKTTVDEDDTDMYPMLHAVALSEAELLFFPLSHPETGSRIVQQAEKMKSLEKLIFIGGEGMLSDVFIKESGSAGFGVYILGPATAANPANDKLREEYRTKYHEAPPSFYYSFAYDAVNLLLSTIEKTTIQDKDGTLHLGRQALRERLNSMDYNGITGYLKCDPFGDCGSARLNIVRLNNPITSVDQLRNNVIYTYTANP
jgi:branched-chain amino acid transport system substrate-binding protein